MAYPPRFCVFDIALDELTPEQQRDMHVVARAIVEAKRFSAFDATATEDLGNTMDKLAGSGWLEFDNQGYPWTGVKLTAKGRVALQIAAEAERG